MPALLSSVLRPAPSRTVQGLWKSFRNDPGQGSGHRRKVTGLRSESVTGFIPESCPASFRNGARNDFGIVPGLPRNPHSVLLEAGLRKKELMHLEDSDLICDEFLPGTFKCELKIESKPQWGHLTKTGHHRKVLIGKELMDRLLVWREKPRPSALLFGTKGGQPDWHWWDRLKKVAERCGVNPDTVSLQKFPSTAATTWLRPKERGGYGWDISFVRQQLGHEDYKSVERYLVVVKNEEMAMTLVPRWSGEAA